MHYYHYARYIEKGELPRNSGLEAFLHKVGVCHHFASHYALITTHVQVLRHFPKTVQNVGPHCGRIIGTSSKSWHASQTSAARIERSRAGTAPPAAPPSASVFAPASNRSAIAHPAIQTQRSAKNPLAVRRDREEARIARIADRIRIAVCNDQLRL